MVLGTFGMRHFYLLLKVKCKANPETTHRLENTHLSKEQLSEVRNDHVRTHHFKSL